MRDDSIVSISPEFYPILDQALAAEEYGLTLITGMGYRKALEYLVKDYVTADLRGRLEEAVSSHNAEAECRFKDRIDAILRRDLKDIIQMIPHDLTAQAAERCAWLGNDETHYTRRWTDRDIEDLKQLLSIVLSFIGSDVKAKVYIAAMPRK